eukprot:Trichotokara_eunicae@DN3745_c0_g1_i1.p1
MQDSSPETEISNQPPPANNDEKIVPYLGRDQQSEKAANSIQVSLQKTPSFYARIARKMMTGGGDKEVFDHVIVTGLGMATKIAIGTAGRLEEEKAATVTKIETSYFQSSRTTAARRIPKITLTLQRNPNAPPLTA